ELLERIRDIRASEKRFYQKARDLFAKTSQDYNSKSKTAHLFFQTIQNKMVFAVTGQTAAELIVTRADPDKPNMALTSWEGSKVRKKDITISKNYLYSDELSELNRLVTMFLDFAEDHTRRRQTLSMHDWINQTNRFLKFNERNVLTNAGSVSHDDMKNTVAQHFDQFDTNRQKAEAIQAEREALEDLQALETTVKERLKKPQ
ncbi:MAG: RhuM family protein, partial [Pseudomonadota bacterium]